MSINTLTNAAVARRPDFAPHNRCPNGLSEIAMAAAGMPAADSDGAAAPERGTTASNGINTAMNVLIGYIPTETLTLYVAVVAALHPAIAGPASNGTQMAQPVTAPMTDWVNFFGFLVATPLIVWLIFAAKVKSAQKTLPTSFSAWPVWEMVAATVAYAAWAFALPDTPFHYFSSWYTPALGGVAVLVASTVLGLLAPLFQNKLGT